MKLRRRRIAELASLDPAEPVIEKVRHHQKRMCRLQRGRPFHRVELKQSVELHELQPGVFKDLLPRDDFHHPFHHSVRARIAVVIGIADQHTVAVKQGIVHTPSVDPERDRHVGSGRSQAHLHFIEQPQRIPMQAAQHTNARVRKAM